METTKTVSEHVSDWVVSSAAVLGDCSPEDGIAQEDIDSMHALSEALNKVGLKAVLAALVDAADAGLNHVQGADGEVGFGEDAGKDVQAMLAVVRGHLRAAHASMEVR